MIPCANAVVADSYHNKVLTAEGVWVAGSNEYGQLGNGLATSESVSFRLEVSSEVKAVAAGRIHSILLKQGVACGPQVGTKTVKWAMDQRLRGRVSCRLCLAERLVWLISV